MTISNFVFGRKKWVALACCLLATFIVACATMAPKERPATLVIQPASAKAGAVLVIKGYEFLPNEEVEVILTVGDLYHSLGTGKADVIVANKDGSFEASSGVPVRTPPGTYKVEASGNKGSMGVFNLTVIK